MRLKFLVHCTFEWGVKSVQQKASYAKSKQATEPQTLTYTVTIGGYIHSEFHAIPHNGYGDLVYSKIPRLFHHKANLRETKGYNFNLEFSDHKYCNKREVSISRRVSI